MSKNYYDILGISNSDRKKHGDEFDKVLKQKYRKLSMKYHPDRHANDSDNKKKEAEEKFKEVAEAYSVLSDNDKRNHYDQFGTIDGFGGQGGASADDIMREFMRAHGFGGFGFGGGGMYNQPVYRGTDKKIRVGVTVEEIYFQKFKDVTYEVDVPCDKCGGKGSASGKETTCPYCQGRGVITETKQWGGGYMQSTHPCPHCGGTGQLVSDPCSECNGTGLKKKKVSRELKVPKIDQIGYTYKIDGEGNACANAKGGKGDLYFTFVLKNEPNSKYYVNTDGSDTPCNIYTNIDVSVFDCITGSEIEVPHIDGKRKLTLVIPAGTKDDTVFKFRREGLSINNGMVGDFCVKVNMTMPQNLNDEQIKKLKEIANELK